MRRHDSSSGDEEEALDSGVTAMDTSNTNNSGKHRRIPPPVKLNGSKSNPVSPQHTNGKQTRPVSASRNSGGPVRFFILKSHNRENVERSIDQGVWSTQKHNQQKLAEAFESSQDVFLIFSVNQSSHFQGYARMTSGSCSNQARTQWEGIQNQALGSSFDVEWRRLYDLPFTETEHLHNPLNEDKPVKISRDGQELPPDLGEALVQLFEEGAERNGIPRPANVRSQGPPAQGRMGPQGGMQGLGMMGRGIPGRGMLGRGRGGPEMLNAGMNMPGPEFFGNMGMPMPMGGMPPMMPMGPNPMMMGMGDMDFNRMGGFDGSMGMGNMASMGMGMGPMGNPMMMGMGGMGDMGGGFPMGAMPPPRPPPRRTPEEGPIRPGINTSRPYSNDRLYEDERPDDYRDQPRSGYSRDHIRDGPSGSEYGRRSSPLGYESRDSRHRGRERSYSPHRRGKTSSRRRSRSRSRSRSRGRRSSQRPSFLDMDYSEYKRNFQDLQESRSRSRRGHDGRGQGRSNAASGRDGNFSANPGMTGGLNPMMLSMMDEDVVVNMYAQAYRQNNQPFDPERCRSWFRRHKESMLSSMNGMGVGRMMGLPGIG